MGTYIGMRHSKECYLGEGGLQLQLGAITIKAVTASLLASIFRLSVNMGPPNIEHSSSKIVPIVVS